MNNLIRINYGEDQPTVSARELHEGLEIKSNFTTWFERMIEYGFTETDYKKCFPNLESSCNGGQNMVDYEITVDMAKEICMIQRTEKGRKYRQYFLTLEKTWNSPEQIMARALKMADKEINHLKTQKIELIKDVDRMKPKEIFADAVSSSSRSILVGELAKLLKQNGVDTGEKRLFTWLRNNGYLIKRNGTDYNMPTQRSMNLGLFEIKETTITHSDGFVIIHKTPKITGKGQHYFINKFLNLKNKSV